MGENHPYEKYNVLSINHLYFHHPETTDTIPWTGLPSRSYPLVRIAGQDRLFHRFYAAHGAAPTRIGVVLQCDIVVGAIATESPTVWVVINICI